MACARAAGQGCAGLRAYGAQHLQPHAGGL